MLTQSMSNTLQRYYKEEPIRHADQFACVRIGAYRLTCLRCPTIRSTYWQCAVLRMSIRTNLHDAQHGFSLTILQREIDAMGHRIHGHDVSFGCQPFLG